MARPKLNTPRFRHEMRNGVWHIVWTWNGQTNRRSTGTDDEEAAKLEMHRFAASWLANPPSKDPKPVDPTIGDLIKAYLREYVPNIHGPQTTINALRPIYGFLGTLKPADLSEEVLEGYAAQRSQDDRWGREGAGKIQAGTIAREVNALRGCLSWAYRRRLISEKATLVTPVDLPAGKMHCLSRAELRALMGEASDMKIGAQPGAADQSTARAPHLRLFLRLAIATAARKGAILDLRWSEVDLSTASVRQVGVDREGEEVDRMDGCIAINFGAARGNKRRPRLLIANNPGLYTELVMARGRARSDHVIEFRGKQVADIKKAFHAAREAAGLDSDVTPHALKHTSISWMVAAGLTFSKIALMTNTNERTLERVYGHLSPTIANEVGTALSL